MQVAYLIEEVEFGLVERVRSYNS
jgi:hypothetical protein